MGNSVLLREMNRDNLGPARTRHAEADGGVPSESPASLNPMLASSLLIKKRDGLELQDEEIRFLIDGFCCGDIADYQMSALAMAICLNGMNERETVSLTTAMLESGERLPRAQRSSRASNERPRVDKHSTGGLGDKVSLILAPLLASCDVDVPMISGRGLGLSGGTLDKLESIEGFESQVSIERSSEILRQIGCFIVGASSSVAPADRRLYALRDVTGTVESIPLITASILSKKLAANLDALVMDVKTGSGAFMKSTRRARELADSLVRVGRLAGLPTTAILSDMDQPLGEAVGNANEVNEAIDILTGDINDGPVRELTLLLCGELLVEAGVESSREAATHRLTRALDSGAAMEKFEAMVAAQGGRLTTPLPLAVGQPVVSPADGYVANIDCQCLGEVVVSVGGGRRKTDDPIDHTVGLNMLVRTGDRVQAGQPLLIFHGRSERAGNYLDRLQRAIQLSEEPTQTRPLVLNDHEDLDQQ